MSIESSILKGLYKGGAKVVREATGAADNLMNTFGTYNRVTRPGNAPGWEKPTRLEARFADRALNSRGSEADSLRPQSSFQIRNAYNYSDHMERGEAATASATSATRTHIAQHLKSKGIKHKQKNPVLKGGSSFNKIYSPRGGDLEPGHYTKTNTSKKDLLARQRRAAAERKAGPKGGMR